MKAADLCLKNGKIATKDGLIQGSIGIKDEKIISIKKSDILQNADRTIDLEGAILLPGIVDSHVHFRDPGLTHKEDFHTGSRAAVAGGVTTVCDMPNTSPPTDSPKRFREKIEIAEKKSLVDFGLHAMLSDSKEKTKHLLKEGATSLKLYPEKTNDRNVKKIEDEKGLVSIHPEDPQILNKYKKSIRTYKDFLDARPEKAENSEINKIFSFEPTSRLHFCHITTKKSVELIQSGKKNVNTTCEVTPHHLLLEKSKMDKFGSLAKMHPPLRKNKDRNALLESLRRGDIDIVATDHAPHTLKEKKMNFGEAPPGIAGIETSLPLIFTLVKKNKISLKRMVEAMCTLPAKIFGLKNKEGIYKGSIEEGADADLVAIDQNKKWKIKGRDLHGKTKFTPFEEKEVIGKPFLTIVRGKIVFKEDKIIGEEGHGRFIKRKI